MLTLELISLNELQELSSQKRIEKLLNLAKENKIVLIEGILTEKESAALIKITMESIDEEFRGIELAVLSAESNNTALINKWRLKLANMLLGGRRGITIIGPASVVKEIKQDPNKISLYTNNFRSGKVLKQKKISRKNK